MQNKKLIILIILSVTATLSLIYGIVTPSKTRHKSLSKPACIEGKKKVAPAKRVLPSARGTQRTIYPSWGRSPFILPPVEKPLELKLNGVVWDKESPRAIINNNIVGIGDKVGTNTVIDIKQDRVILNNGTSDFELRLGE